MLCAHGRAARRRHGRGVAFRRARHHDRYSGGRMTRVLIAEDVRILRDTLSAVLSLEDDIEVVAEVSAGDDIARAALRCRPEVAIVDIDLPGVDGITAAAELNRLLPQ